MFLSERQQEILEILKKKSSVTAAELERKFKVSSETVRRDLIALESQKQLIRVHGGALSINHNSGNKSFEIRNSENMDQKRELSLYAAEFINEGDVIALDFGSTPNVLASVLAEKFDNLTVITNSLMIFETLKNKPHFKVILLSGEYCREEACFFGVLTVQMIESLHISKYFLAPTAISIDNGITCFDEKSIMLMRALCKVSNKVFVIADSSKFDQCGIYKIMPLSSDLTVITDKNISDDIYNEYINNDINIIKGE